MFDGEIKNNALFVGNDRILENTGLGDQKVTVGIRPEGFLPDPEGSLVCELSSIEVMGRDTSVVASHPACQASSLRAIIGSDSREGLKTGEVRFKIKPDKVHIFDSEQVRIS